MSLLVEDWTAFNIARAAAAHANSTAGEHDTKAGQAASDARQAKKDGDEARAKDFKDEEKWHRAEANRKDKIQNPHRKESEEEVSVSADEAEEAVGSQAAGALLRGKRKVESLVSFAEASKISLDLREVRCRVLVEGLGNARDKHFYGPESVSDVVDLINQGGVRCFLNHQTEAEHRERSEGDIRKMAGYWKDGQLETLPDGRRAASATLVLDESEAGDDLLAKVQASLKFSTDFPNIREVYAGLSINGDGEVDPRTVNWQGQEVEVNYVREVSDLPSVDGVTRPAREGQFLKLLESIQNATPEEARTMKEKGLKESAKRLAEAAAKVAAGELDADGYRKVVEAEADKMKAMKNADKPKEGEAETDKEDESESEGEKPPVKADAETEAEDEAEGEDDVEKDGEEPGAKAGGTTTHTIKHEERKVSKESAALMKKLELAEARADKAERRLVEGKITKQLAEAGLSDIEGLTPADLAAAPAPLRRVLIASIRATRESGFAFGGSTPRSAGSDRNAAGSGFAALCESRQ